MTWQGRRAWHALSAPTALALVLAVAACTSLLPGPGDPPQFFVLTPKSTFDPDLPAADWQLVVEVPVASGALNTSRIALSKSPVKLEYFANARWTDRAPVMVQTLLVESFENSGRIGAVGRESLGLRSDYNLKTELREFQVEYSGSGPPAARVRLSVKVVRMPERSIVGATSVEQVVRARENSLDAVISAFDEALGKTLKDVVEWTLATACPKCAS